MLKELRLHHFALAESIHLTFAPGFNVISGETGSGKTMLTEALSLIFGQKADYSFIKEGADKATIQAVFELPSSSVVYKHLQEAGIEIEEGEDLILLREIHSQMKNKVLIQSQQSALPLLKKIAPFIIETISQDSSIALRESSFQRELLDKYAKITPLVEEHAAVYHQKLSLVEAIISLKKEEKESRLLIPLWQESLEEIEKAKLKEGEEEELFEIYKKLCSFQESKEILEELLMLISEGKESLADRVFKIQKQLDKARNYLLDYQKVEATFSEFHASCLELGYALSTKLFESDGHQNELEKIEKRLSLIKQLTKKYGPTLHDVLSYRSILQGKINQALQSDVLINEKQALLDLTSQNLTFLTTQLSLKRKSASVMLAKDVEALLHDLNMEGSAFMIDLEKSTLHFHGEDQIVFQLGSSKNSRLLPISQHASGGELSRILFSLILILSQDHEKKGLIFDEIDANMGGITASLFAKHLKQLGESRQVICITHFPQVAAQADHHFLIKKVIEKGVATTKVSSLDAKERQTELLRMMGGQSLISNTK